MVSAKGVDHCRAGDDANRLPLTRAHRAHDFAIGLEFAMTLIPVLAIMSRKQLVRKVARE